MSTLKQVAAEAGVSVSTASAALRGMDIVRPDTIRKVEAAARRVGYRVNLSARALRNGRTGIFTAIVPDLGTAFYARFANSLSNALLAHGHRLVIQTSQYDAELELDLIRRANASVCDGLFVCPTASNGDAVRQAAGDQPVILFDGEDSGDTASIDRIETPNQSGMDAVIRHLAEDCGRTRIGIVGASDRSTPAAKGTRLRLSRCDYALRTMRSLGLNIEHAPVVSDWGVEAGIATARRLVADGLAYDALCCMNDELAFGVLRGLAECEIRVPEDVAVTGFDGIPGCTYVTPTLTTVAVDADGMAQAAVSMMERRVGLSGVDTTSSGDASRSSHAKSDQRDAVMSQRLIAGFRLIVRESTMGRAESSYSL